MKNLGKSPIKKLEQPEDSYAVAKIEKRKESIVKPLKVDNSGLMFSIKQKAGLHPKKRKRFVDKEKENNLNKSKSLAYEAEKEGSFPSSVIHDKSSNYLHPIEVGYIKPK